MVVEPAAEPGASNGKHIGTGRAQILQDVIEASRLESAAKRMRPSCGEVGFGSVRGVRRLPDLFGGVEEVGPTCSCQGFAAHPQGEEDLALWVLLSDAPTTD